MIRLTTDPTPERPDGEMTGAGACLFLVIMASSVAGSLYGLLRLVRWLFGW